MIAKHEESLLMIWLSCLEFNISLETPDLQNIENVYDQLENNSKYIIACIAFLNYVYYLR